MLGRIKIGLLLLTLYPCMLIGQNDSLINYSNKFHKYQVEIPNDWSIYYENKNDTIQKISIIAWGLPKTYDSILNQEVENSISIKTYNRPSIKSISDLTINERLRTDPTKTSLVWDSDGAGFQRVYFTNDGVDYFGKIYYKFQNGIGYVITFMATEDTYDKNVGEFDLFYSKFRVIKE